MVGTPYAFNVVSRTLDIITGPTIEGAGLWYVDDLNACSNKRTCVQDMSRVDDEVRTLLGSESVAAEKDKSGRRLDMIGWLIDLDAQLVTISEKNFNKTLHAFFSFNIVSKTPTSTSLSSSGFFSRRAWVCAMVYSLCWGTVDPRWLGCCRVECGRCYVDVRVSDSLFLR